MEVVPPKLVKLLGLAMPDRLLCHVYVLLATTGPVRVVTPGQKVPPPVKVNDAGLGLTVIVMVSLEGAQVPLEIDHT